MLSEFAYIVSHNLSPHYLLFKIWKKKSRLLPWKMKILWQNTSLLVWRVIYPWNQTIYGIHTFTHVLYDDLKAWALKQQVIVVSSLIYQTPSLNELLTGQYTLHKCLALNVNSIHDMILNTNQLITCNYL